MNYYKIFYWLSVSDGVKGFFNATSTIFTWMAVLSFVAYVITSFGRASAISENRLKSEEEDKKDSDLRSWELGRKYARNLLYPMLILCLITWTGYVFTPTKKDCLLIIAGGAVGNFITTDSSAKELPSDVTKFLHMSLQNEIKDLSAETKKELGIETQKDKLLEKVKQLSKDELIKYLSNDTVTVK
jgi:hypothetical protein